MYMYYAEVDAISFDFSSNSSSLVSCEDFGVFCHGVWLIVCLFFILLHLFLVDGAVVV